MPSSQVGGVERAWHELHPSIATQPVQNRMLPRGKLRTAHVGIELEACVCMTIVSVEEGVTTPPLVSAPQDHKSIQVDLEPGPRLYGGQQADALVAAGGWLCGGHPGAGGV